MIRYFVPTAVKKIIQVISSVHLVEKKFYKGGRLNV